MIEEHENRSSEFRSLLDVVHDRFRLRWRKHWNADLWETLRALAEEGKEQQGFALLPNRAPNLKLVAYQAFNPLLLSSNEDAPVQAKITKCALSLTYAWDLGGNIVHFIVVTESEVVDAVLVVEGDVLETVLLHDGGLKAQLEASMKILLP